MGGSKIHPQVWIGSVESLDTDSAHHDLPGVGESCNSTGNIGSCCKREVAMVPTEPTRT